MTSQPASRRDRRPAALLLMSVGVVLIGLLIAYSPNPRELDRLWHGLLSEQPQPAVVNKDRTWPKKSANGESADPHQAVNNPAPSNPLKQRLDMHFQRAAVMLHAKEYEHALVALRQVMAIAPQMPEAYVNSGYALLGLERFDEAKQAFLLAIDLRPEQANAYYGLAVALDALRDRMGALGAMYSYLHRAREDDPFRRKAAAAVWEWEAERDKSPSGENPKGAPAVVTNKQG